MVHTCSTPARVYEWTSYFASHCLLPLISHILPLSPPSCPLTHSHYAYLSFLFFLPQNSIIPQIWNPQNPITPPLKPTATASHTFINHHSMKLQIPQNISSELLITLENLQVPGICLQISIPLMTMVSFTVSNNSKIEISLVLWGEGKKSSILWFCGDEGWSPCEGIWKGLR